MDSGKTLFARRQRLLLAGAALLLGSAAQAQTLDFGSCVRVDDASQRLACYDRAAGRPATAAAPVAAATAAPAAAATAAPATAAAPVAAAAAVTAGAAASAAAPAAAAPVAAAAAKDPVASFGAPSASQSADPLTATTTAPPKTAEAAQPSQIEAKVTAVKKRPHGEQVLTLENGQVWEQTEVRSEPQYEAGDTIVIRRGMLGSFLLTMAKGGPTTRVRRIS